MSYVFRSGFIASCLVLAACSGGGPSDPAPSDPPAPPPPPTSAPISPSFETTSSTARFLAKAGFGARAADINRLTGTEASDWVLDQFNTEPSLITPGMRAYHGGLIADRDQPAAGLVYGLAPTLTWWTNAIHGEDQLRQRVAFALSQILVTSRRDPVLDFHPEAMAYYMDVLNENAFGNYRDLLEDVTYSPAMGVYLTYRGNQKADPETGRMPDENYAREILQLFTVGLVELNPDGTPVVSGGQARELFDNDDITGLARVFTGLNLEYNRDEERSYYDRPMQVYAYNHSEQAKSFLGLTIPANTPAEESIDQALDHIMAHPNVGPFISRQLIQRLVTSNPDVDYVERVSRAFDTGQFTLPNGVRVGDGRKGDMQATISAILFDPDAEPDNALGRNDFGKIREPVLRFIHWARAFEVNARQPELVWDIWDTSSPESLSQGPFLSPSVFNFYRPGYVPPRTEAGDRGMTVPEMQIVNATSTVGYVNFMTYFVTRREGEWGHQEMIDFIGQGYPVDETAAPRAYVAGYETEMALAHAPEDLADHLNALLVEGQMTNTTRQIVIDAVNNIPLDDPNDQDARRYRVEMAVMITMTSTDYLVQR